MTRAIAIDGGTAAIHTQNDKTYLNKLVLLTESWTDEGAAVPATSFVIMGAGIDRLRDFLNEIAEVGK